MLTCGSRHSSTNLSISGSIPEEINVDDDSTESRDTYVSQLTKGDFGDETRYGCIDDDSKTMVSNGTFQSRTRLPLPTTYDDDDGEEAAAAEVSANDGDDVQGVEDITDGFDNMSGTSTKVVASGKTT
jgi:hypothetical protein